MTGEHASARKRLLTDMAHGHPPLDLPLRLGSFGYSGNAIAERAGLVNDVANASLAADLEMLFLAVGEQPGSLAGAGVRKTRAEWALKEFDTRAQARMFVDAVREYHTANRGVAELHVPLAALRERVRAGVESLSHPRFQRAREALKRFDLEQQRMSAAQWEGQDPAATAKLALDDTDRAALMAHRVLESELVVLEREFGNSANAAAELVRLHPDVKSVPPDVVALLLGDQKPTQQERDDTEADAQYRTVEFAREIFNKFCEERGIKPGLHA